MKDAQTVGPLLVVASFVAAEAAALALETHPGNAWAWYLNIEVFRPFEVARSTVSPLRFVFGPATLFCSMVAAALIIVVRIINFRLGRALLANLSCAATLGMAYAQVARDVAPRTASLAASIGDHGSGYLLLAIMIGASGLASALSHAVFLEEIAASVVVVLDRTRARENRTRNAGSCLTSQRADGVLPTLTRCRSPFLCWLDQLSARARE